MPTAMSLPSFGSATSRGYRGETATMFRILVLSAVLVVPTSLAGQRLTPVPSYAGAPPPSLARAAGFDRTPFSTEIPHTYWLEGGIIGGGSVGVVSALYYGRRGRAVDPLGAPLPGYAPEAGAAHRDTWGGRRRRAVRRRRRR